MITEIKLFNFRGFESHSIPLKPVTIIVGKNNAGKSTIVEALRLIRTHLINISRV
ncbi:MAG TPA: AAA family ATPase [Verrucomicrobiae bacterium]|nr:AAA family ATPase [Verrucomicrobiae bacterium]